MYTPSSTYRIQFNKDFTFKNLLEQLPYLKSLGVGAIYASPVFAAVPGSNHGYDVTDASVFNPEIGTSEEFEEISRILKSENIGWIQDIVPNHMAFHPDNHWLMDVLEKGKQSAYAHYFDIDWEHPNFTGRLMVPVLGKKLEQAVSDGEIKLCWNNGGFFISYYDFHIPISGDSFHNLLDKYKNLEESFYVGQGIAKNEFKAESAFSGFGWSNSRERFQAIYETDNSFETLVENICKDVNNDKAQLRDLLNEQHYTLTHWQDVEDHLNYRRFFTINGLISLSMERNEVFEDYHQFIHEKVKEGKFQGLRIDHIDGLKAPSLYFEKLRAKMGEDVFIVVEKILEHHEELEKDWPIQGSSGYDFLAIVNNLFTNQSNYSSLSEFYKTFADIKQDPEELIHEKKKMILHQSFRGDWDNICQMIEQSGLVTFNDEVTPATIREAVGEFLICCPVYKLYSYQFPLTPEDETWVKEIIDKALEKSPYLKASLNALENIFTGKLADTSSQKDAALSIFLKCMQYSGPLMAKGVEDTSMYIWSAFIAHNEVGDAISASGISAEEFHRRMIDRKNHYPMSINATATHDTKRGEDARARLNVLSDLADEWMALAKQWAIHNKALKTIINEKPVPDSNEEYFIYQTIIGMLPADAAPDKTLLNRLEAYFQKSLREAKIHSNWNKPNEDYENAVNSFVRKLLSSDYPFRNQALTFVKLINSWGIINSLSQVVLKCTCPGIPDFYQGTELWDFSLVDPDNRRAVDYTHSKTLLSEIISQEKEKKTDYFSSLLKNKEDGRLKLWMTHKMMLERAAHPDLFIHADYIPLDVIGDARENILAFARTKSNIWYITVIPLHPAVLPQVKNNNTVNWGNTHIVLPAYAPRDWRIVWNNQHINHGNEIIVGHILQTDCPAVLKGVIPDTDRGSGILMHISSLPGRYGTGDLGEEAYKFVDFLQKAGQKYWQILPCTPVGGYFSPYSSTSAFAGNTNFIDPVFLYKKHLIEKLPEAIMESSTADFILASQIRTTLIGEAFRSYIKQNSPLLKARFERFCHTESYWLNDYALYSIFKDKFENRAWNEWTEEIRTRNEKSMTHYTEHYAADITRIKFGQFLFSWQFSKLKRYANARGIKIIGDMPIYVSYDSADVWANPALFDLDEDMKMRTVAGVPPDYFSENGQLWNMPIYNWDVLQKSSFIWWKNRIRKNLELCDLLRFDHFRAFASYWEVPAGETTAKNGQWVQGPGELFFSEMKKEFPHMPFIAEDLGDIDEDVYHLRDKFALPGMRVLQFAFGDNMPSSVHTPHMHSFNSVVYTGTHDNNTLKGWYKNEVSKAYKKQFKAYFNKKIDSSNISEEFIRSVYSSVARIAIVPMQDILNLDETARFNTPSQASGNWTWKLKSTDIKEEHSAVLKELVWVYGR